MGLPMWHSGKESTCQFRRHKRHRLDPWIGKISWSRKWQPIPIFLPRISHGQRNLVGLQSMGSQRVGHWAHIHTHNEHFHMPGSVQVTWDSSHEEGRSVQLSSVTQSCPTLCNPMNRSTPDLPVHHQLREFTQTHVHRVSDPIQPSHPLSSPSPPAPNPSQHQGFFQWVNSLHQVAKVLEFQPQHQSFQWTPRTGLL